MNYGGFWIRFLAYLVDSVIVFILVVVLAAGVAFLGEAGAALIPAVVLGVPVLYWALMHASARQATIGKGLLGLKVTDAAGARLAVPRSLAREVCKYISAIPFMIGFIIAGFTKRKQALHDFFASTTVVREGRAHVLIALIVGLFGWIVPGALVMVVGVGLFAGMMGLMGGDMIAAVQEAQKPVSAPAPKPAPQKPAAAAPQKPAAPAPSAPVAQSAADVETLLAARLSGIDRPGTTRAGPAILELDSLFGGSFTIKTYLPLYKEFDGNGVSVQLTRVVDAKGAELYDPKHNLETAFFQRVSISSESSPVPHLAGRRSVHLKSGATSTGLERAEGVVKLAIPVKPATVSFDTGVDLGKQHTAHGVGVTLKGMKGNAYTFEYKGEQARIVATNGLGADQKPVALTGRGGGGNVMTYNFAGAVSRIDVVVAESLSEHAFPFALSRTSLAGPAGAPQPLVVKSTAPATAPSEPAKATPPAKPMVLAQAKPEPAKETPQTPKPVAAEPAKEDKPKPVARKPRPAPAAAPAAQEPAKEPAMAAPAPMPVQVAAAGPAAPGPRFNDLMTAVLYRDVQAVEELIAFGKWVDKPDSRGTTPLQLAASLGDAPVATVLLKAGANPNRPGPGGETALSIARERNDAAMLGLLKQYGAR